MSKESVCPYCGKDLVKTKLTLSVNKALVDKAKAKGLNISVFLEERLREALP